MFSTADERALTKQRRIAKKHPTDVRAYLRMAEALRALGRPLEALEAYEQAAALYQTQRMSRHAAAVLVWGWRMLEGQLPDHAPAFVELALELATLHSVTGFLADGQSVLDRSCARVQALRLEPAAIGVAKRLAMRSAGDPWLQTMSADALRLSGASAAASDLYLRAMARPDAKDGHRLLHCGFGLMAVGAEPEQLAMAVDILERRGPGSRAQEQLLFGLRAGHTESTAAA